MVTPFPCVPTAVCCRILPPLSTECFTFSVSLSMPSALLQNASLSVFSEALASSVPLLPPSLSNPALCTCSKVRKVAYNIQIKTQCLKLGIQDLLSTGHNPPFQLFPHCSPQDYPFSAKQVILEHTNNLSRSEKPKATQASFRQKISFQLRIAIRDQFIGNLGLPIALFYEKEPTPWARCPYLEHPLFTLPPPTLGFRFTSFLNNSPPALTQRRLSHHHLPAPHTCGSQAIWQITCHFISISSLLYSDS